MLYVRHGVSRPNPPLCLNMNTLVVTNQAKAEHMATHFNSKMTTEEPERHQDSTRAWQSEPLTVEVQCGGSCQSPSLTLSSSWSIAITPQSRCCLLSAKLWSGSLLNSWHSTWRTTTSSPHKKTGSRKDAQPQTCSSSLPRHSPMPWILAALN